MSYIPEDIPRLRRATKQSVSSPHKIDTIHHTTGLSIRLDFIEGLAVIVQAELSAFLKGNIFYQSKTSIYISASESIEDIRAMRSVSRAYIVRRDRKYNPKYVSNHKTIILDLIRFAIVHPAGPDFRSYKLTCAGANSPEIRHISDCIAQTFRLVELDPADLKLHIVKIYGAWEVGAQLTVRPLSLRKYKVKHMPGAIDPTIAYSMNSLCNLKLADSYLNIFSGSATLLIEAAECYPKLQNVIGFDNDKTHLSLSMQNIRMAGLLKRVRLYEKNIYDKPNLGKFEVITSDLPFGMVVSKRDNLPDLYRSFFEYCQIALTATGRVVVCTVKHKVVHDAIQKTGFRVMKTLKLRLPTNVGSHLPLEILVCLPDEHFYGRRP